MKYVGEIIREKRLSRKLSLNQVASELNISKFFLEKIEADEIDANINNVFFIGHLRSYSNYLELNSKEIVEKFKLQNNFNNIVSEKIPKPNIVYKKSNFTKIIPFFSILIISSTFYFLFIDTNKLERDYSIVPDLPEQYGPIIEKMEIELNRKKVSKNIEKNQIIENERSISSSSAIASVNDEKNIINDDLVTLKFLNPTWVQVRDLNNDIILSQLMKANEEYSYNLNLEYTITAGNAGNILVLINNNIRGKVGDIGQVVDSFIIDSNFNN